MAMFPMLTSLNMEFRKCSIISVEDKWGVRKYRRFNLRALLPHGWVSTERI